MPDDSLRVTEVFCCGVVGRRKARMCHAIVTILRDHQIVLEAERHCQRKIA